MNKFLCLKISIDYETYIKFIIVIKDIFGNILSKSVGYTGNNYIEVNDIKNIYCCEVYSLNMKNISPTKITRYLYNGVLNYVEINFHFDKLLSAINVKLIENHYGFGINKAILLFKK